tara:strand:- start:493 stop:708 length:216 start_codon:yes stop_codon:yes gene_type:complete
MPNSKIYSVAWLAKHGLKAEWFISAFGIPMLRLRMKGYTVPLDSLTWRSFFIKDMNTKTVDKNFKPKGDLI